MSCAFFPKQPYTPKIPKIEKMDEECAMTRSRMTIDVYLKQAGITAARPSESKKSVSGGNFSQMLSALTSPDSPAASTRITGKTIADYLASRVPANRLVPASGPGTKRENFSPSVPENKTRRTAAGTETKTSAEIDRCIKAAAEKYDLSEALIKSVIQAESGFRKNAVSPAGAKGLMQLMPATARELGVTDVFDVGQNIDGGARYLRQMLDRFNGDTKQALSAYNAGPGAVERYNGNVPYKETRHYVKRVLAGMKESA